MSIVGECRPVNHGRIAVKLLGRVAGGVRLKASSKSLNAHCVGAQCRNRKVVQDVFFSWRR